MTAIEGRIFEKGSAASDPAILVLDGTELVLRALADGQEMLVNVVSVSPRIAQISRKISLADGRIFETLDNDGVDAIYPALGVGETGRVHRLEAFRSHLVWVIMATVGLVYVVIVHGLPIAARVAANITPQSVMTIVDAGVLETVDRTIFSKSALPDARRIQLSNRFMDLQKVAGLAAKPSKLMFRTGDQVGANAFALPGGTVVVTDELVKLAANDDEILSVLAHELGHVVGQHSLRQIYRVMGFWVMVAAFGGDSGQIVEDVVAHGSLLMSLSYSRQFELDADSAAMVFMTKAGLNPSLLATMLEKLTADCKSCGDSNWYASHPAVSERVKRLRN